MKTTCARSSIDPYDYLTAGGDFPQLTPGERAVLHALTRSVGVQTRALAQNRGMRKEAGAVAVAVVLVVAAFVVPHLHLETVTPLLNATPERFRDFAATSPIFGWWNTHVGPGTIPAIAIAAAAVLARQVSEHHEPAERLSAGAAPEATTAPDALVRIFTPRDAAR